MSKRVLFYHDVFPSGGAERTTIDLSEWLASCGYSIFVITRQHREDMLVGSYLSIINLPDKEDIDSLENADFIIDKLNLLSIDIFVLPIHILRHLKYIMSNVECKLVFSLHSVPFWEVKATIERKRKSACSSFTKKVEWIFLRYPKILLIKSYDRLYIDKHRFVYEQADAYTVLCDGYRNTLIKKLGLCPMENKIRVISNSESSKNAVNLNKKNQLLYVGRMSYEDKRVDRLIDIWSMIYRKASNWELILLGDGDEKKALEDRVSSLGLERIRFVGHVNDVKKYYDEASILCLTSNFEGWPLCLTEAQANGVVPIAFNCSEGISEILSPSGANGLLIPPFRKSLYAKRLLELMNNPELLSEMRLNVLIKSKQYAPDVIGKKWLDLFESLFNFK